LFNAGGVACGDILFSVSEIVLSLDGDLIVGVNLVDGVNDEFAEERFIGLGFNDLGGITFNVSDINVSLGIFKSDDGILSI